MTTPREIYYLSDICLLCAYSFVTTEQLSTGEKITHTYYNRKFRLDREKIASVRRLLPTFCTVPSSSRPTPSSSTGSAANGICRACRSLIDKIHTCENKLQKLKTSLLSNYAQVLSSPMRVSVLKTEVFAADNLKEQQQQQCDVFPQSSIIKNVSHQGLHEKGAHTHLALGDVNDDNHLNGADLESCGYNLNTAIKTEPFDDIAKENETLGEVTPLSLRFNGPGDITLSEKCSVSQSNSQFADAAVQVCPEDIATATRSREIQTDFDPSSLIVLDPASVMVLDPSQVPGLRLSHLSGFDPAQIPCFDPSGIPGYDPSQEYRAFYVNRNDRVCQEAVEPMDEVFPQSSLLHTFLPSSEINVSPNIEEVVRFTENIQIARDKVIEALAVLKSSECVCPVRLYGFAEAMQKMVDAASSNILKTLEQLTDTTKQQKSQLSHLVEFLQKIQREQCEMEKQFLKFRNTNLRERCASNRKNIKTKFMMKNESPTAKHKKTPFRNKYNSSTDISKRGEKKKIKRNVK